VISFFKESTSKVNQDKDQSSEIKYCEIRYFSNVMGLLQKLFIDDDVACNENE